MRLEEDKEFLRCEFCKNIVFPEKNDDGVRVLVELSELSCPGCAVPLVHAALEGWRMLYCSKCAACASSAADIFAGTDPGSSRAFRWRRGHPARARPQGPPAPDELSECQRQMDTHTYYAGPGNVIIDDCETCHLNWLDYGETWTNCPRSRNALQNPRERGVAPARFRTRAAWDVREGM
jgi:Zn-finger nucleic acid-binding protein